MAAPFQQDDEGQTGKVVRGIQTVAKFFLAIALVFLASARFQQAEAVPAFAQQTGQPCATCHVGAFGPQLKPYGQDFKLRGYTATEGKGWRAPLAVTIQTSFTHTQTPQAGGAARWFAPNDNFALEQVSFYYAGRIAPNVGAFVQLTYDGIARVAHVDNVDLRYAREFSLLGIDSVGGITVNNSPTVSDLWNSTPVWGFPYNSSSLAPGPVASTIIDGQLGQRVVGSGIYGLFGDGSTPSSISTAASAATS